jgi:hypothetical protein
MRLLPESPKTSRQPEKYDAEDADGWNRAILKEHPDDDVGPILREVEDVERPR